MEVFWKTKYWLVIHELDFYNYQVCQKKKKKNIVPKLKIIMHMNRLLNHIILHS